MPCIASTTWPRWSTWEELNTHFSLLSTKPCGLPDAAGEHGEDPWEHQRRPRVKENICWNKINVSHLYFYFCKQHKCTVSVGIRTVKERNCFSSYFVNANWNRENSNAEFRSNTVLSLSSFIFVQWKVYVFLPNWKQLLVVIFYPAICWFLFSQ